MKTPSGLAEFFQQERERKSVEAAADSAGNELLRRAALVRWFDEEIYREALAKGVDDAPEFKSFIARREVRVLSERDGTYIIRETAREQQLNRWRNDSLELRRFSAELVRFYRRRSSPVDVFAQRIFADPTKALGDFEQLYAEADRNFDLARCDELLRILRNRGDQRGPSLTAALNDREQYFWSRSLFGDDWIRTAHFLKRPKVTERFREFLKDDTTWIFRLYAAGGAGKTAYLRWLIARYCVPERGKKRTRIPVARVDLDFVHVPAAAEASWLLLIPLAEQLNLQLPLAPFYSFLESWRSQMPALQRPVSRARAASLPAYDENRQTEVTQIFAASLGDERVVVVLDTLEEVILHHAVGLDKLLASLSQIREHCPGLKVVLSGRYDPFTRKDASERIRGLKSQSVALKLPEWDRAECWEYLTRIRRLRAGMPFESFRRPARGNPFKVALFADLIGRKRPFTHADLRELRRVEVEYLVERVIERIPESDCPLRWLLRYIVTARQLTEDFVEHVLAGNLQRAMTASGADAPDRPSENLPKGAELLKTRTPWKSCTKPFKTAEEWPALLRYAGPSSWITISDGMPRPQPELVSPMRFLLQEQPIFWDIHRDAAAHFERLAGTDGHDWGDMMCEAIYHRFQYAGSEAGGYWADCLKKEQAQNGAVRRKLAECLLSGDFVDDREQPLPHKKTGTIVSPQTLAEAYLELGALDAREALQGQTLTDATSLLEGTWKRLKEVRALEEKHGFRISSDSRRALVEVAVTAGQDPDGALRIVEEALKKPGDATYWPALLLIKGNMLLRRDKTRALQAFQQAADYARAQKTPIVPLWRIEAILGHAAFEADDLEAAAQHYDKALDAGRRENIPETDLRKMVETVTEIDRASANWSRALSRLPEVEQTTQVSFVGLRSLLQLDASAPAEVIETMRSAETPNKRVAGLACAMLGDFTRAVNLLEDAWKSDARRDPGAAAQARFEQIRIILREMGDYRRAKSLLANLLDLGEYRLNGAMLLLEVQVRMGEEDAARAGWQKLREASATFEPRRRASVLATGLALELEPRTRFDDLLEALAPVRPASARLAPLAPFGNFQGPTPAINHVSDRFREILPLPQKGEPDFIKRALLLADTQRFQGDRVVATKMLDDALEMAGTNWLLRRQVVNALMRLDAMPDDQVLLAYAEGVNSLPKEVGDIARLELAEWWIKRRKFDLASRMFDRPLHLVSQHSRRYAIARGQIEMAADHPEPARKLFGSAASAAVALGIAKKIDKGKPESNSEWFDPEYVMQLQIAGSDWLKVVLQSAGAVSRQVEGDLNQFPVWNAFTQRDPFVLYQALQNRNLVSSQLGMLLTPLLQGLAAGRDLRIDLSDETLAAMPWEWAINLPFRFLYRGGRIPTDRLEWFVSRLQQLGYTVDISNVAEIQAALQRLGVISDGWRGTETRRRLNAKLMNTGVAIIKPSTETERASKSGHGSAAISIEGRYQSHGIVTTSYEPWQLTPPVLRSLANFRFLHICLPLTELSGLLQLGSVENVSGGGLSASFLSGPLPASPRPVVLLDPPMPARNQLWAQQLVWRNAFAHQLFENAAVEAVIAAGLVHDGANYLELITSHLEQGKTAGELIMSLTVRHPETATVLYASDPGIPLP